MKQKCERRDAGRSTIVTLVWVNSRPGVRKAPKGNRTRPHRREFHTTTGEA